MEFLNPKNILSSKDKIETFRQRMSSNLVYCHEFKIVDKKFFDDLKEIENSKAKAYCCVVWVSRKINKKDLLKLNTHQNIEIK